MSSIQDRLKKVPPFEEDVEVLQNLKEVSEQQVSEIVLPEKEELVEESEQPQKESQAEDSENKEEETKNRTKKQFDKLKKHNKELKEENEKLYKNVMESLKPDEFLKKQEFTPEFHQQTDQAAPNLKREEVEDIYANLITKDELGNPVIDPDLLIKTLKEANEEAKTARKEAKEARRRADQTEREAKRTIRDFEESREVRIVHKKYPQIDPKSDDFNEMFWDDVRKEIATAPILRGENVSFMEAADKIWNERYAPKEEVEEVNKKEKEKMEKTEDAKRNINASTPTTSFVKDYYSKTENEALKQATIAGKKGALAERLRRSGY